MSAAQDHQEIIIIKRGHDDHDDHHGGAWKIAFADFMTAMFCLFLVLWLVNAANEETKQAVASYFNPVKLVDRNRSTKGLYEARGMQDTEAASASEAGSPSGETNAGAGQAEESGNPTGDAAFFADPYEALDEIASAYEAGDDPAQQPMSGMPSWTAEESEFQVETFLDPFAPERWTERPLIGEPEDSPFSDVPDPEARAAQAELEAFLSGPGAADALQNDAPPVEDVADESRETAAAESFLSQDDAEPTEDASKTKVAEETEQVTDEIVEQELPAEKVEVAAADAVDPVQQAAEALRTDLTEALRETFGPDNALVEQLSVEAQEQAILISLTDNLQIPMFEIGSAVPSPPLVLALEQVGTVIGERGGVIRIEGHTDARPFTSGEYDNWRLSAARAQAAYYMLVRGGVDEARFGAVSGMADRDLADPADPFSARNRRIDILLELGPS